MESRNEMKSWNGKELWNENEFQSEKNAGSECGACLESESEGECASCLESESGSKKYVQNAIHSNGLLEEEVQQDSSIEIAEFVRETYGVIHVHEHYCQEDHERDFDPERSYYGLEHYFQSERNAMAMEKC